MMQNIQFRLAASLWTVFGFLFYNPLIRTVLTRALS
jgi:hypothetical protein